MGDGPLPSPLPAPPILPHTPYSTSEAMSSSPRHCRSFSFWTRDHISGSLSARLSCPVQPGRCPTAAAAAVPCCARQLPAPSWAHRCRACVGQGGLRGCHPSWAAARPRYPRSTLGAVSSSTRSRTPVLWLPLALHRVGVGKWDPPPRATPAHSQSLSSSGGGAAATAAKPAAGTRGHVQGSCVRTRGHLVGWGGATRTDRPLGQMDARTDGPQPLGSGTPGPLSAQQQPAEPRGQPGGPHGS